MSTNNTSSGKVEVNGDAPSLNPTLQNDITRVLVHNGGVKRIEAKLKQGLDEIGWSQQVREYATQLLRSGEVTTFPELEERVRMKVFPTTNGATTFNNTVGTSTPNLAVPKEAWEDGAAQVRKELNQILETKKPEEPHSNGNGASNAAISDAAGHNTNLTGSGSRTTEDTFRDVEVNARKAPSGSRTLRSRVMGKGKGTARNAS